MNKIVKFVVLPLTALIVIVVAIGAYVAATFDPNQYKGQIVQAVKDKTKRTLKLDGDIKLSLFPSIGAKLGKSSLSEYASEKEFAALEDLRVSLKLMPLPRSRRPAASPSLPSSAARLPPQARQRRTTAVLSDSRSTSAACASAP